MRYDLRHNFEVLLRVLPHIGQTENASAITRRVENETIVEWVSRPHGQDVWAEVGGALETAATFAKKGSSLGNDVRLAQRAYDDAYAIMFGVLRQTA